MDHQVSCRVRKSHFFVINVQDPAVGNGNLMRISAKILDRVAESVESFLDIRTPVFFVKIITESRPFIGVFEFFAGRGKSQPVAFIKGIQFCQIFSFELIP